MIEVAAAGAFASVQDRGRIGWRRLGVPRSGVLAPPWMTLANALVGNDPATPVIECFEGGLALAAVDGPCRVAAVGDAELAIERGSAGGGGGRRRAAAWRSHRLEAGERLVLRGTGRGRFALVALGGLRVESVLGSASTYARAGLGGIDGRALVAGDRLALAPSADPSGPDLGCAPFALPGDADGDAPLALRAVPGPQQDAFDPTMLDAFFANAWTLSAESDRMGARLEGEALAHRDPDHREIVSDAIVPGSVQVPGGGLPIVMLADAHTAGGYPKIATVASSDLAALALARPGRWLRLHRIDVAGAVAAARDAAAALERHLASIAPLAVARPDTATLLSHNLVDGVTDGS